MKLVLNLYLFVIIAFSACKKDSPIPKISGTYNVLPPYTIEGKNTFGCLLDSKLWLMGQFSKINGDYGKGYIYISMKRAEIENGDYILIRTPNRSVFKPGMYPFDSHNIDAYYQIGETFYITNDTLGGILEITKLDSINFIISGKFNFKSVNNKNKIVSIDSGRFDLKYIK